MSDIEAQNGSADCDLDERTEQAQQLLNPKMEDMQKSTGIEMRDAQNPPPGVQSGISNFNYQPQPCDTTTPASSPDYNQENDRTQPTKVKTKLSRQLTVAEVEKRQQTLAGKTNDANKKLSTTSYATNSALAAMLTTVMSSAGFTSPQEKEAISNTVWFLSEYNDNFKPQPFATEEDSEELVCPSNDNINLERGCSNLYLRWLSKRLIHHIAFRVITVLLVIIDVILVITAWALDCPDGESLKNVTCLRISDVEYQAISITDLVISTFFVVEVGLRMYAMTPKFYFSKRYWFNIVDFVIVIISFLGSVSEIIAIFGLCQGEEESCPKSIQLIKFSTILRIVRIVKLFRVVRIYTEHHQFKRSMRQFVSQNKQRWVQGEHDLDLTYITKNVIGMSFPSKGLMAWYRNNINDVAKFLDETHGGHYKLYNLCSERTYDYNKFHNQVVHWPIGDHNVPTVKQMVDFVSQVNSWLSEDEQNVAAIHCKGGKGRTGTMICILLIYRGLFRDAKECLYYFGQRRTDTNVSEQFQGVETASQIRYVTYYEKLLSMECTYPDPISLQIEKINISGLSTVGKGNGTDLSITVHVGQNLKTKIYEAQIWNEHSKMSKAAVQSSRLARSISQTTTKIYCSSEYNGSNDMLEIDMIQCPRVCEDVRVQFHCSSKQVPKAYESCAFYFWFHTSFLEEVSSTTDKKQYYLKLSREEIDNPHKPKTWDTYTEKFQIEMYFSECDITN